MGLIAQRVADWSETRSASDWLTRDDDMDGGRMTSAGVRVDGKSALTLSAFWRCVDILASAAAYTPKDVYLKVGGRSFPQYTKPSWMSLPDPRNHTFTLDDYFYQVAVSLLMDGNYYTLATPSVSDARMLTSLDPARVRAKPMGRFDILDDRGRVVRTVGDQQMLHGRLFTVPGSIVGVGVLQAFPRSIGAAIAAEDFAARFFGQGAALSFGVEVPYAMDANKLDALRESLRSKYVSLRNSHAIGVLADGGKFVTGLAPTPEQAQMLETRKFGVEDISRIFGIPPGMLGSQEAGASSYASSQTWKEMYKEITLYPLIARIEKQHSRLLSVPDGVADATASMQFKVNLDAYLRMDAKTRFETYEVGVRSGVLTPDYARGKEDLEPLPGGDQLYMQAQMTPLTLLANPPAPVAPQPARSEPVVVQLAEQRSAVAPYEIHNHLPTPEVRNEVVVQPAPVAVENHVSPTPVVVENHVEARSDAPAVNVTVPAPSVTVKTPDTIRIESMPSRKTTRRVTGRGRDGGISEITETESDA